MGDKKIVRGASENCHTEDNSPKNTYTNHKFMLKYNYGRYI